MTKLNRIEFAAPEALRPLSDEIREKMEKYRVPASVRRKTGIRSLRDIPDAWLIVLCSPETPDDPEVTEAIARFTGNGHYNRILTLLTEGSPETSFPDSLLREVKEDGTVVEREPLAANIAGGGERERRKKFEVEKLRLIAPILGVSFDDLMERRKRQRNRILAAVAAFAVAGAGCFLGFALNRMNVMAEQQKELEVRQSETEAEQEKAEEQREAALISRARTAGLQAKAALENGDTELGLLLCLEYLPEMKQIPELTDALKDGLHQLAGEGYAPVTTRYAYQQTRALYEDASLPVFESIEYKEDGIEKYVKVPVPGDEYKYDTVSLKLMDWSREYRYAVYSGLLKKVSESGDFSCVWLYFPDHPEDNRFVRDENGACLAGTFATILPDGSFFVSDEKTARRVKPLEGDLFMPVPDGSGERTMALPFSLVQTWDAYGFDDRIIALSLHGTAVFSRNPFTLLYTISDVRTMAFDTAPRGSTYWTGFNAYTVPNGERYLVIGLRYVYDAETGKYLYEMEDNGKTIRNQKNDLSSEGYLPIAAGNTLSFWDLSGGEPARTLRCDGKFQLAGPIDPETGRNSASVILAEVDRSQASGNNQIVYEYRETGEDIPEETEAQITMALRLLNGRELTEKDKRENFRID